MTFTGQQEWSFIRIGKYIWIPISSSLFTYTVFVLPFVVAFQRGEHWFVSDFSCLSSSWFLDVHFCCEIWKEPAKNQQWQLSSWSCCMWRVVLIKLKINIFPACWKRCLMGWYLARTPAWVPPYQFDRNAQIQYYAHHRSWMNCYHPGQRFLSPCFHSASFRADSWHELKPPSLHRPSSWMCTE